MDQHSCVQFGIEGVGGGQRQQSYKRTTPGTYTQTQIHTSFIFLAFCIPQYNFGRAIYCQVLLGLGGGKERCKICSSFGVKEPFPKHVCVESHNIAGRREHFPMINRNDVVSLESKLPLAQWIATLQKLESSYYFKKKRWPSLFRFPTIQTRWSSNIL